MARFGSLARFLWAALLLAAGCAGTEGPIFESTALTPSEPPPAVSPPPGNVDSGGSPDPGEMVLPAPINMPADEDAGTQVDLGLDPDATFEWTETLPGAGTCKRGRYVGGFDCTTPGITGPVSISGEIAFTLVGSTEEQTLVVDEGSIGGLFFNAADMSGTLDCTHDRFDALTLDGQAVFVLGPGTFAAALTGAFDDQALGIEGVFSMINAQGQICDGTFRVGIAP